MEFEFLRHLTDLTNLAGPEKQLPRHTMPTPLRAYLICHAIQLDEDSADACLALERAKDVCLSTPNAQITDTITTSCMNSLGSYLQEQAVRCEVIDNVLDFLGQTFQTAVRVGFALARVQEDVAVA
jgi:hypothetical protein